MKSIFSCICLVYSCLFTYAQTYTSSCIPSGARKIIYHNDACRLAIKRLHVLHSPLADSVTIPTVLIDSVIAALYAVDQMQGAVVNDTLRPIFGHSDFIPGSDSTHIVSASTDFNDVYGLKAITITVDDTAAWAAQWLTGNYYTTGNDTVNYLLSRYQLTVTKNEIQPFPNRTEYLVHSPVAINAGALARQWQKLSGIQPGSAREVTTLPASNGNIIEATFAGDIIRLSYTFGCGDCPVGCTIGRTWNFTVHTGTDCAVSYTSVITWGSHVEWLTRPCLEYLFPVDMCPAYGSTVLVRNLYDSAAYQWQVSTDGVNFTNIIDDTNYVGTNTSTLQLNNIPSAWYGKVYTCLQNGNRNKVSYSIRFVDSWKGLSDSAWENVANWSCNSLPDTDTDVVIEQGTVTLNSIVSVRTIRLAAGATLVVAPGAKLNIAH